MAVVRRQTGAVTIRNLSETALVWVLRAAWIGVAALGGAALDGAVADRSEEVGHVARWGSASAWAIAVGAMAVPAVVTLTLVRVVVPLSVAVAALSWLTDADAVDAALFTAVALLATVVAFSADVGRAFVQASAYGDEDRHLLRAPAAYGFLAGASWVVWAALVVAGPLLLAGGRWVSGGVLTALAAAGAVWAWPRWHRLSRRWLVIVPAGLVIHDHLVLAETLMIRRQEVAGVRLAPQGTVAADLTGPAAGHALEISTSEAVTALLAADPTRPRGSAIHLTACLVGPTRPGRALRSIGARRFPVG